MLTDKKVCNAVLITAKCNLLKNKKPIVGLPFLLLYGCFSLQKWIAAFSRMFILRILFGIDLLLPKAAFLWKIAVVILVGYFAAVSCNFVCFRIIVNFFMKFYPYFLVIGNYSCYNYTRTPNQFYQWVKYLPKVLPNRFLFWINCWGN